MNVFSESDTQGNDPKTSEKGAPETTQSRDVSYASEMEGQIWQNPGTNEVRSYHSMESIWTTVIEEEQEELKQYTALRAKLQEDDEKAYMEESRKRAVEEERRTKKEEESG